MEIGGAEKGKLFHPTTTQARPRLIIQSYISMIYKPKLLLEGRHIFLTSNIIHVLITISLSTLANKYFTKIPTR